MLRWLKLWVSRCVGIILCARAWLVAVGILSLGSDWYLTTFQTHGWEDLLFHGIVGHLGEGVGASVFFGGGVLLLWLFWQDPAPVE